MKSIESAEGNLPQTSKKRVAIAKEAAQILINSTFPFEDNKDVRGIILYGSTSRGEDTELSDIDLCITVEDDHRWLASPVGLKLGLAELGFCIPGFCDPNSPYRIDLGVFTESEVSAGKDPFFVNIRNDGIILLEKPIDIMPGGK